MFINVTELVNVKIPFISVPNKTAEKSSIKERYLLQRKRVYYLVEVKRDLNVNLFALLKN